jgi:glutamyl-tRNA reductase
LSIIAVGVNHASSPLAMRERLSIATHQLPEALAMARCCADEIVLLSTCNRTEAFARVSDDDGTILVALLAEWGQLDTSEVARVARVRAGRDAITHALRVASGLDSMVLGEDQIQAQFRHALTAARAADTLGPMLESRRGGPRVRQAGAHLHGYRPAFGVARIAGGAYGR